MATCRANPLDPDPYIGGACLFFARQTVADRSVPVLLLKELRHCERQFAEYVSTTKNAMAHHDAQTAEMKKQHTSTVGRLEQKIQGMNIVIETLEGTISKEAQSSNCSIMDTKEKFEAAMAAMESEHQNNIYKLRQCHEAAVAELQESQNEQVLALERDREELIATIHKDHAQAIQQVRRKCSVELLQMEDTQEEAKHVVQASQQQLQQVREHMSLAAAEHATQRRV